jgi:transcriptional regulator with XRE-family HTH domain
MPLGGKKDANLPAGGDAMIATMPNMPIHADERRIAALLRELIQQSSASSEEIESRLGWEPGRLNAVLSGRQGLSFEVLLEVLPVLDETPGNFFARLYGFHPREAEGAEGRNGSNGARPDRRFEESRRVVKDAIARRSAWKEERSTTTTC